MKKFWLFALVLFVTAFSSAQVQRSYTRILNDSLKVYGTLTTSPDSTKKQLVKISQVGTDNDVDIASALPTGTNTIGAVNQSGIWTVQPGNTANTTAWLFKLSQTTTDNDVDVTGTVTANAGTGNFTVVQTTASSLQATVIPSITRAVTIKRVAGAVATSGDNTVISAVVGKKITVLAYSLQCTGTANAKFTDGAAGTQLSMLWNFQAREGVAHSMIAPPDFYFQGSANTALILNLSAAVSTGFEITYFEE